MRTTVKREKCKVKCNDEGKKRCVVILLMLLTFHFSPFTLHAAFRDQGFSTRAMGMGGAFVAISDDASAAFVNPAGLSQLKGLEGSFMYAKPYAGIDNLDFGVGALSLAGLVSPNHVLGGSATVFSASGFVQETVGALSYAYALAPGLSIGANAKFLNLDYKVDTLNHPVFANGTSKSAFTLDLGFLYRLADHTRVGFAGKNLLPADVGLQAEDNVPAEYQAGIAQTLYQQGAFDLTGAIDVSYRDQEFGSTGDKTEVHLGLENWFAQDAFAVRIGGTRSRITAGGSILKPVGDIVVGIDYGFQMDMELTEDNFGTHRASLLFKL